MVRVFFVWRMKYFLIVYSVNGHSDLAALVKASPYFQGLLQLSVECWDMDGDHTTLPVVFEDIYCEASIAKHRKLVLFVCVKLDIFDYSRGLFCVNLPASLVFNYRFSSEDISSFKMEAYILVDKFVMQYSFHFNSGCVFFQSIPVKKWTKWKTRQQEN